MKKMLAMITLLLAVTFMLSSCGGKKTVSMENIIQVNTLEEEPVNWISEEAISVLVETALPAELQRTYMELISDGYKEVVMKDPEGWLMYVRSNENGIYVGNDKNDTKFFKSTSGNVVEVCKVYRTLYRAEYFDGEKQKAYDSIELDYQPEELNLVNIAVTDDFSVMYNTQNSTYQCMQYGVVIGTSGVTNLDAALQPEKTPKPYGANKGFIYNKEWYVPVIERDGTETKFYIVKESDFEAIIGDSISYVDMKLGKLELKACEIVR